MQIFINVLNMEKLTIDCEPASTVQEIKEIVRDKCGIPLENIILTLAGKKLWSQTLASNNIREQSTLNVLLMRNSWDEEVLSNPLNFLDCRTFCKVQEEELSKDICTKIDTGHVQYRAFHYGILYDYLRKWMVKRKMVKATTAQALPLFKSWTKKNESSVASALQSYFTHSRVTSMRGFDWILPTAFGDKKIVENRDVKPIGLTSLFISYSWSFKLSKMIHVLNRELTCDEHGLFSDIRKDPKFSGRLWIDCFAINQHGGVHTVQDLKNIEEVIKSSTHGTVLFLENMKPLSRIWCIYELYHSIINKKPIYFMIPFLNTGIYGRSAYVGLCLLLAAGLGNRLIDCNKAEATVPADRETILHSIEQTCTVKTVNDHVRKCILEQSNQTLINFLDRSKWTSTFYPEWEYVTRHERKKQLPGWLDRLRTQLEETKLAETRYLGRIYDVLGVAFMNGEECMDEWLELPWNRKPMSRGQFKVKRIIARRRKNKKVSPPTEMKELPGELSSRKKNKTHPAASITTPAESKSLSVRGAAVRPKGTVVHKNKAGFAESSSSSGNSQLVAIPTDEANNETGPRDIDSHKKETGHVGCFTVLLGDSCSANK